MASDPSAIAQQAYVGYLNENAKAPSATQLVNWCKRKGPPYNEVKYKIATKVLRNPPTANEMKEKESTDHAMSKMSSSQPTTSSSTDTTSAASSTATAIVTTQKPLAKNDIDIDATSTSPVNGGQIKNIVQATPKKKQQQSSAPATPVTPTTPETSAPPQPASSTDSQQFWDEIDIKIKNDAKYITQLMKNGRLRIDDCDAKNRNILDYAAFDGNYEICQLCLNMNADISHKNVFGADAATMAHRGGNPHIIQMLKLRGMKASLADRLTQTAEKINRQNGIVANMWQEIGLPEIASDEHTQHALVTAVTNLIQQKLSFSDDLLLLCWKIAGKKNDPLKSNLWSTIRQTCAEVINAGVENTRDWVWLKEFIFTSNIWYQKGTKEKKKGRTGYLYDELFSLIDDRCQALMQVQTGNKLEKMSVFEIGIEPLQTALRQDSIDNGLISTRSEEELRIHCTDRDLNALETYNRCTYLSQLALLAKSVDDEFQQSIQTVFNVSSDTNAGVFVDDELKESTQSVVDCVYHRRPVLSMENAQRKLLSMEQVNESFPSAACLLDLNSCVLAFESVEYLQKGVKFFQKMVSANSIESIVEIVAMKNDFQSAKKTFDSKSELKLHVIVNAKNAANSIVAEVRFTLNSILQFQQATKDFAPVKQNRQMSGGILAALTDRQHQMLNAAALGDVEQLAMVMINHRVDVQFMLGVKSKYTVLSLICRSGQLRCLRFMQLLLDESAFLDELFKKHAGATPLEQAIICGHVPLVRYLISLKEVQQRMDANEKMKYRAVLYAVSKSTLSMVNLLKREMFHSSEKELLQLLHAWKENYQIVHRTVGSNTLEALETIPESFIIAEIDAVDEQNKNVVELAILRKKQAQTMYLLRVLNAKQLYSSQRAKNHSRIFRLLFWIICFNKNETFMDDVLNVVQLNNQKDLTFFAQFRDRNVPSDEEQKNFDNDWFEYHNKMLIPSLIQYNTVQRLQRIMRVLDEQVVCEVLLHSDGLNVNGLEKAIRKNKTDIIEYILSFEEIRQRCVSDKEILWRILYWLQKEATPETIKQVITTLKVSKELIEEMQKLFQVPKPDDMSLFHPQCFKYWKKKIPDDAVNKLLQ